MNRTVQDLVREVSRDNTTLRASGRRTDAALSDCLQMLENAGMGKPGAPYGNTLRGMTMEACERLANVKAEGSE